MLCPFEERVKKKRKGRRGGWNSHIPHGRVKALAVLQNLESEPHVEAVAPIANGIESLLEVQPEGYFLHSSARGGVTIQPSDLLHFTDPFRHTLLQSIEKLSIFDPKDTKEI